MEPFEPCVAGWWLIGLCALFSLVFSFLLHVAQLPHVHLADDQGMQIESPKIHYWYLIIDIKVV